MNEINRSISESVKNGQYYIDARRWYLSTYVSPVVDRNITILLGSFFIICIFILVSFYLMISEASNQITYLTDSEDVTQSYALIKPISDHVKNPQKALEEYMTILYIKNREAYNYDKVEESINFVINNSTTEQGKKFQDYMSINNYDSPLLLYQNHNYRSVAIKSVERSKNEPNSFFVKFQTKVVSLKSNHSEKNEWIAKIKFQMSDMNKLLEEGKNTLDYKVTEYSVNEIK